MFDYFHKFEKNQTRTNIFPVSQMSRVSGVEQQGKMPFGCGMRMHATVNEKA